MILALMVLLADLEEGPTEELMQDLRRAGRNRHAVYCLVTTRRREGEIGVVTLLRCTTWRSVRLVCECALRHLIHIQGWFSGKFILEADAEKILPATEK
jgi:hypothetical protein